MGLLNEGGQRGFRRTDYRFPNGLTAIRNKKMKEDLLHTSREPERDWLERKIGSALAWQGCKKSAVGTNE